MTEPTLVTAADIARLAGVTRATVSNWRRRHPDFPAPTGGTDASPAYDRSEVEVWLAARGSLPELPPDERLWRAVTEAPKAGTGNLGDAVIRAARAVRKGALPTHGLGPEQALDSLIDRYADTAGVPVTPSPVADLMAVLAEPGTGVVLDPACGTGELLAAAARKGAAEVFGQEIDDSLAELASIRISLRAPQEAEPVATGDSLRDDKFADLTADVVLCHPPFGDRDWGHEELAHDPRWHYGIPPKSEPELAWAQAAITHLRPGGRAVMLMPPALAARPSARRIRAEMVRKGVIRAVISLPAGIVRPQHVPVHLWIMDRPADTGKADPQVLFVDATQHPDDTWQQTTERILNAWRQFQEEDTPELAGVAHAIDLLDDTVDLSPARHVVPAGGSMLPSEMVTRLTALDSRLRELLQAAAEDMPENDWPAGPSEPQWHMITLADLDRSGSVWIHRASMKPGQVTVNPGDVTIPAIADGPVHGHVVTDEEAGELLGENQHLVRPDPSLIDSWFLAGFLVTPTSVRLATYGTNGSRIDVRRMTVPLLPLTEQQEYGEAFHRLRDSEAAAREIVRVTEELTGLIGTGLTEGAILPRDRQNT